MRLKKFSGAALLFLVFSVSALGQYDYPGSDEDATENKKRRMQESRWFFGGNLGLSLGTYTYIELSPLVGYKVTPRLWAGIGPKYQYIKYRSAYETNTYGFKTFASFTVLKNISETINIGLGDIFLYGENETINAELFYYVTPPGAYYSAGRSWYNVTLIGGGMRFPLGARGGFSLIALWDITQHPEYNYPNPEIRMIFDF